MVEATYVLFVPKAKRSRVRTGLASEAGEDLKWRERRTLFGSEFYLSGPAMLARQVHAAATAWINEDRSFR
jgi:hypothetical protein